MATLDTYKSDVVLGKVQSSDLGYGVDEVTVTIEAGMKMGAALESTSVSGKFTWVVAGTVDDCDAVLIDPQAEGYDGELPAGDYTLVVARRGHTIAEDKFELKSGTAANKLSAIAAFEKAGMNKVTDKVLG